LIGISGYGRAGERQAFSVPCEYVDVIAALGGVPLMLPPVAGEVPEALEVIDALVLSGGGDVDPEHYGGQPHAANYGICSERDRFELALARAALARRPIPVLCVCRGMQVMNVALGGTLVPHIPDHYGDDVLHRDPGHKPCAHPVRVEPSSRVAAIMGATDVEVRSWHHQAVDRLGQGLRAVAWSPDGVVEAVELEEHPFVVAVQWHPEIDALVDLRQRRLFEALLARANGNGRG
jgi:putative glutamine amidotransferase